VDYCNDGVVAEQPQFNSLLTCSKETTTTGIHSFTKWN